MMNQLLRNVNQLRQCYTRQFTLMLVSLFVAALRDKLNETLRRITYLEMNLSRSIFAAVTAARNRTDFYFSQRLRQQQQSCATLAKAFKNIATNSFCNY